MGSEKSLEGAARKSRWLIYSFLELRTHLAGLLGHSLPTRPRLISNQKIINICNIQWETSGPINLLKPKNLINQLCREMEHGLRLGDRLPWAQPSPLSPEKVSSGPEVGDT